MKLFNKSDRVGDDAAQAAGATAYTQAPGKQGGKGRATPKRRDAQARASAITLDAAAMTALTTLERAADRAEAELAAAEDADRGHVQSSRGSGLASTASVSISFVASTPVW